MLQRNAPFRRFSQDPVVSYQMKQLSDLLGLMFHSSVLWEGPYP